MVYGSQSYKGSCYKGAAWQIRPDGVLGFWLQVWWRNIKNDIKLHTAHALNMSRMWGEKIITPPRPEVLSGWRTDGVQSVKRLLISSSSSRSEWREDVLEDRCQQCCLQGCSAEPNRFAVRSWAEVKAEMRNYVRLPCEVGLMLLPLPPLVEVDADFPLYPAEPLHLKGVKRNVFQWLFVTQTTYISALVLVESLTSSAMTTFDYPIVDWWWLLVYV